MVDSHVHVVAADIDRYPLRPGGVGSSWWRDDPVTVERLLAAMDGAGVERAVIVQAVGAYSYDCAYSIDGASAHPDRLVTVVAVDMNDPGAAEALRAMAGLGPVGGVRLVAMAVGDGAGDGKRDSWLDNGTADGVWDVAADKGLSVVVTLFAHQLRRLLPAIARRPAIPVAVDHCGFPELSPGLSGPTIPADAPIFDLADLPNVYLKVTTLLLAQAAQRGDPADLIDQLASAFGPGRLVWGSDFPQTTEVSYPDMVALARRSCRRLAGADQARFLGGTALVLWP